MLQLFFFSLSAQSALPSEGMYPLGHVVRAAPGVKPARFSGATRPSGFVLLMLLIV